MSARGSNRLSGDQMPAALTWLSSGVRLIAVPALAVLWWALAFLPWTRARLPAISESWPPSLPAVFTDLDVAVFGPLGASLVVVALLRRAELALLSILIGFGVSAWVTLSRGADIHGNVINTSERYVMLAVCAFAAFGGLAIGTAAIRSLRAFGFLGLLAVTPVVSLAAIVLIGSGGNERWLTRSAIGVLLVMIAWRGAAGVLVWPLFFALFWLLNLFMSALGFGAQSLRHPGGAGVTVGVVADAMVDFIRSAWGTLLGASWNLFWPAALIVALAVASRYAWSRAREVGA